MPEGDTGRSPLGITSGAEEMNYEAWMGRTETAPSGNRKGWFFVLAFRTWILPLTRHRATGGLEIGGNLGKNVYTCYYVPRASDFMEHFSSFPLSSKNSKFLLLR